MFGWIIGKAVSWITGDLTGAIERAYTKKLEAETDAKRLAAEYELEHLKQRAQIIANAQSDPFERFIRIFWTLPFVIYTWKLIVWDKILTWGVTDNLSPELWSIMWIVLGGYFIDTVVRRFKG